MRELTVRAGACRVRLGLAKGGTGVVVLLAALSGGCSLTDLSGLQGSLSGGEGGDAGGDASVSSTGGDATDGGSLEGTGGASGSVADAAAGSDGQDSGSDTPVTGPGEIPVSCGNGVVQGDEACDTGGESPTCNADCTVPVCGDSIVNTAAGEECDVGGVSATCNRTCQRFTCPSGCSCEAAFGHVYMYCEEPGSFDEAEQVCDDADMHVAYVASVDEDFFVRRLANTRTTFFLGATDGPDAQDEGRWRWGDRRLFWRADTGEAVDGAFTNWAPGEPNDFMGAEDCLQYDGGQWDDAACETPNAVVCERTPSFPSLCGDGNLNFTEACDDTEQTARCDADCTFSACGDGVVNDDAGEECDDNDDVDTDACDSECNATGLQAWFVADEEQLNLARSRVNRLSLGRSGGEVALDGAGLFTPDDDMASSAEHAQMFGDASQLDLLDFAGEITIAFEVRFASTPPGDALLVGHTDGTDGVLVSLDAATLSAGSVAGGSAVTASATVDVFDDAWHHVAVTYDGTEWQLYVDGSAVGDAVESDQGSVMVDAPWTVFGTTTNTRLVPVSTGMRQLRIYDRGLDSGEIAEIAAL